MSWFGTLLVGFPTGNVSDAIKGILAKGIRIHKRFSWTGYMESPYKHFQLSEIEGLDPSLVRKLDVARDSAGVPFIITCGLRTQAQNDALAESVKDSSHLRGLGVDLACSDSQTRYAMLSGLLGAGFNRIGVYSAHLHADVDSSLPPNVIWFNAGT